MEKMRFGKTGLMVSPVAFGGIPIQRLSVSGAAALVKEIVGLGINFIDTAHVYMDSEEKIGLGIKGIKREDLVIATKTPVNDKKTFNENLDLSLSRLGVDYVDIYQFHGINTKEKLDAIFAPGGAMEAMEEAVRCGKVRFPAFSSHNIPLALEIMKGGKFAAVQLPFNYVDTKAGEEAIPLAKKLDMGFIAMKPMGGGRLYDAGLSFRFLCAYPGIVPDPGIEKIEEIREIIAIVEKGGKPSAEDEKEIEKQRAELGPSWCHFCDYCQPCSQGIHISAVLCVEGYFKRMTLERVQMMAGTAIEKARGCTGCGNCMKRCPYNLDIPSLLKEKIAFWDARFSQ